MLKKLIAHYIAIVIPRQRRNGTVEKIASKRVWVNLFTHKASESNFNRVKSNARPFICRPLCEAVQTQCGNYIFLKLPHEERSAAPCYQQKGLKRRANDG